MLCAFSMEGKIFGGIKYIADGRVKAVGVHVKGSANSSREAGKLHYVRMKLPGLPHYKQKSDFLAPSHGCVIQKRAIMCYTLFVV